MAACAPNASHECHSTPLAAGCTTMAAISPRAEIKRRAPPLCNSATEGETTAGNRIGPMEFQRNDRANQ